MNKIGLVGLPNAGKSTLFNTLTGANALMAAYPFSTVDPNKATFKLLNQDVIDLAAAITPNDLSLSDVYIWDIAGLIEGASEGEGLGSEFLGHILECDIIVHVLKYDNEISKNIEIVNKEIIKFDHKLLQKPFEKARRMAKLYPKEVSHTTLDKIISKAYYGTAEGKSVSDILSIDECFKILDIGLISAKPKIYIINVFDEKENIDLSFLDNHFIKSKLLDLHGLSTLTDEEAEELGESKSSLSKFILDFSDEIISMSKSKSFYTIGHLGIGMWVTDINANCLECAELIHTDLNEKIKSVKVANVKDFIKYKNWQDLSKLGLTKKYSANYVPKARDILLFEL